MRLADLIPRNWTVTRTKKAPPGALLTARQTAGQGPYTNLYSDIVPREVNPWLYETLRETIPVIDGAINRLCTLDGILRVEAESDALEASVRDFMDNVRVGDMDNGLQTFYKIMSNEKYEQGFVIGEYVYARDGKSVAQLRVADSKGVYFRRAGGELETWYAPPAPKTMRADGADKVQRALRNSYQQFNINALAGAGYRKLDPARLFYQAIDVEATNPYGTSMMRSLEFSGKSLLTIHNAILQTWERFGDPVFELTYKTKSRATSEELTARQKRLADNLAKALEAKRAGNAMDFVNALGRDDDLVLKVIGADNQVLELETPARHLLEQIVSKWGIAPWMLGFVWGTSERLADRQADMVIQETKTRFENARGRLESIIAADLRARGITWSAGDWRLVQELPNLKSEIETAQADFLRAQTELMLSGARRGAGGLPVVLEPLQGEDPAARQQDETDKRAGYPDAWRWAHRVETRARSAKHAEPLHRHKAEDYIEDGEALMRLESRAETALLAAWGELQARALVVLGLDGANKNHALKAPPVWIYDMHQMHTDLLALQDEFVAQFAAADAPTARTFYEAWARGVANGAAEFDADAVTQEIHDRQRAMLRERGLQQVREATVRAFRDDIVDALASGAYDGQNPRDVARALAKRFDAHDYDWERLARSEVAYAQGLGKIDQYIAQGIEKYDWLSAGGACPICTGLESGGPYTVGAGPLPMQDSHPQCRCTIAAAVE